MKAFHWLIHSHYSLLLPSFLPSLPSLPPSLLSLVTDDSGSLTLGLVAKGRGVGRAGSWLALGVSSQSKGMKGMDVGMARWKTVGREGGREGGRESSWVCCRRARA